MRAEKAIYGDLIDRCAAGFNPVTEADEALCAEWCDPAEIRTPPYPDLDPSDEVKLCLLRRGEAGLLVGCAPLFSEAGCSKAFFDQIDHWIQNDDEPLTWIAANDNQTSMF